MLRASILLLLLIILSSIVFSEQYSVSGYTKNMATNEPIKNVNVYLIDLKVGLTTNENGYFNFTLSENFEKVNLEFSHIAFETVQWSGEIGDVININMKESLLKLDEIVITGTKSPISLSDVPVYTEIINNKEIRSSCAMTVGELVEERAGVSRIYNFDGSFNYNLIGLDSKYILILKDGQPITGKFNDKVDLDQITIANVEKIEVLKGPGSALYGTEAMGGVINIISRDRNSLDKSEIKIQGINYSSDIKNFRSGAIGGNFSYDFTIPFRSLKIFSTVVLQNLVNGQNLSSMGKDKINKITLDGGFSWRSKNEKHKLKLALNHFGRVDSTKVKTITGVLVKSNSTNIKRNNILAHYKVIFGEQFNISQNINLSNYKRAYNQIGIDDSYYRKDETNESLIDYDLKLSYLKNKMDIIGGFELSKPTYNSNRLNRHVHYTSTYAQFFQLGYKLSERKSFITGLRFDIYESKIVSSPRLAILIKSNSKSKIRLSYGEGFRVPSFLERFIDFNNTENGYTVIGNKNLNPEKSKGITFNYEYTNNKSLRFSSLAYLNKFSNKIETFQNSDDPIIYRYENIAKAIYQGIEFSTTYLQSSKTSIKMNLNIRSAIDENREDLPNMIPYSFGSQLNYNISKYATKIKFNTTSNYLRELGLYHIHNIRFSYTINQNFITNIGVKNITDYTNNEYGPYIGRSCYIEIVKQ